MKKKTKQKNPRYVHFGKMADLGLEEVNYWMSLRYSCARK